MLLQVEYVSLAFATIDMTYLFFKHLLLARVNVFRCPADHSLHLFEDFVCWRFLSLGCNNNLFVAVIGRIVLVRLIGLLVFVLIGILRWLIARVFIRVVAVSALFLLFGSFVVFLSFSLQILRLSRRVLVLFRLLYSKLIRGMIKRHLHLP